MALYDFPLQRAVPAILGALWLGALAGIAAPPSLRSSPSPRNSVAGFGGLAIVAVAFLLGVPALGRQLALARDLGSVRAALEGHGGDAAAVVADVEAAWRLGASPLEADRLAAAAMASHAPEGAAAVLRAACERDPLWFDHWRWLAEALIAQGRAEEALAAARRAVALEPEIAQTWRTLGRGAWAARDLTLAEGSLERARALAPGNAEILGELGLFWAAQGREAQAIEVLRESLASGPDNAPLWQTLGLAHWRLGQREGALDALNRAVAADPTLGEAWHLLAVIHLDRHEDAEALDCARRAIALLPESDSVRQTLSQALGRLGAEARNASGEANLGLTGPNPRE
jgi:tetratricopeptide (TPR) repeat protein